MEPSTGKPQHFAIPVFRQIIETTEELVYRSRRRRGIDGQYRVDDRERVAAGAEDDDAGGRVSVSSHGDYPCATCRGCIFCADIGDRLEEALRVIRSGARLRFESLPRSPTDMRKSSSSIRRPARLTYSSTLVAQSTGYRYCAGSNAFPDRFGESPYCMPKTVFSAR